MRRQWPGRALWGTPSPALCPLAGGPSSTWCPQTGNEHEGSHPTSVTLSCWRESRERSLGKNGFLTVPTTTGTPALPSLPAVCTTLLAYIWLLKTVTIQNYFARLPAFFLRNSSEKIEAALFNNVLWEKS